VRCWESNGQVLAIFCMYCSACLGVYRRGAGYNLYELLCVGRSLPDRCWLQSVCTAMGMCLPDKCWLYSEFTAVRGLKSTGQVLAIFCMYCCGYLSTGQVLAILCMYFCGYESTGHVLAILCMYCCVYEST
jgi:hypothetical protein